MAKLPYFIAKWVGFIQSSHAGESYPYVLTEPYPAYRDKL